MKKMDVVFLVALCFLAMGCPDPNSHFLTDPRYQIYLYYKNSTGEDLLDQSAQTHYSQNDIRVNELALGVGDFRLDSARHNNNLLPKGFHLSFTPSRGVKKIALDIIALTSTTRDTLASEYSGPTLISCSYNRVNVLPANLSSTIFPVVITK